MVRTRPTAHRGISTAGGRSHRWLTRPRSAEPGWGRSPHATPRALPPAPHWSPLSAAERGRQISQRCSRRMPAPTMAQLRGLDRVQSTDDLTYWCQGKTLPQSRFPSPLPARLAAHHRPDSIDECSTPADPSLGAAFQGDSGGSNNPAVTYRLQAPADPGRRTHRPRTPAARRMQPTPDVGRDGRTRDSSTKPTLPDAPPFRLGPNCGE